MTSISVSLDDELLEWLDQLIERGIIKSRSEAVRGGIYSYVREKLGITSRADLRDYLKKQQQKPFQSGVEAVRSVRQED
ncbi:MAG: ribbon-helix-helix protein, CopG family [Asgard group archaeon]|nr:ribbon-helix-helix protein, CopG family [Asgard group archaeon]